MVRVGLGRVTPINARTGGPTGGGTPSFLLDFADLGAGEVSIVPSAPLGVSGTYTRATPATTVDASGLVVTVGSGVPRSWFDPSSLTYLGYLAEGQRTNLLVQSADTTNASWAKTDTTPTLSGTGPDGVTNSANLLTEGSAGTASVSQGYTASAADVTNTISLFMKRGNHDWVRVVFFDTSAGANNITAWFNLATGAVGTVQNNGVGAGGSATTKAYPDGWYRFTLSGIPNPANTDYSVLTNSANADASGTRVANGTRLQWGAQAEHASFASSYIPTAAATVTKNIDVDQYPASMISASGNSVFIQWTPLHAPSGTIFLWGTYVDANNYTALLHDGTNLIMRKRIGGANNDATIALAFTSGTTYKIGGSWGSAGVKVFLNGVKGTDSANTTNAQIGTNQQIGTDGNGANAPFAVNRRFASWPTQLPDAQLAGMTA